MYFFNSRNKLDNKLHVYPNQNMIYLSFAGIIQQIIVIYLQLIIRNNEDDSNLKFLSYKTYLKQSNEETLNNECMICILPLINKQNTFNEEASYTDIISTPRNY